MHPRDHRRWDLQGPPLRSRLLEGTPSRAAQAGVRIPLARGAGGECLPHGCDLSGALAPQSFTSCLGSAQGHSFLLLQGLGVMTPSPPTQPKGLRARVVGTSDASPPRSWLPCSPPPPNPTDPQEPLGSITTARTTRTPRTKADPQAPWV